MISGSSSTNLLPKNHNTHISHANRSKRDQQPGYFHGLLQEKTQIHSPSPSEEAVFRHQTGASQCFLNQLLRKLNQKLLLEAASTSAVNTGYAVSIENFLKRKYHLIRLLLLLLFLAIDEAGKKFLKLVRILCATYRLGCCGLEGLFLI